jgi:hypothetical protein
MKLCPRNRTEVSGIWRMELGVYFEIDMFNLTTLL